MCVRARSLALRQALIVVPLSTLHNWLAEFKRWAPQYNVLAYVGNATARESMRKHGVCVCVCVCVRASAQHVCTSLSVRHQSLNLTS
jgi:hypothetical protein